MSVAETGRTIEAGELTIRTVRDGDDYCLALYGELDIACADAVEQEVERVEESGAAAVVVDLSGLEFMDSMGIRVLLTLHARSQRDGGRLGLLRGQPSVQQVLRITGVEPMLPFLD